MISIPKEIEIYGIYFPPLLIAATLGLAAAWFTASLLNRFGLSRYIFFPPLFFVALVVIYSCVIGTLFVPL